MKTLKSLLILTNLIIPSSSSISISISHPSLNPQIAPPNQQHPLPFPTQPQTQSQAKTKTTFRDMHASDLSEVIPLVIEAFRPSAMWRYIMPEFEKHETEIRSCLYQQAVESWASRDPNVTFGKVITVEESTTDDRPVAMAIWKIREEAEDDEDENAASQDLSNRHLPFLFPFLTASSSSSSSSSSTNCTLSPGVNLTRAASANAQTAAMERKYLSPIAPQQLYLHLLATHPSWDGHGFGARHCEWGEELARSLGRPLTLIATPAGWPLYDSLGFEGVKNASVELLDGLGELWFEVMKWEG